MKVRKTAAARGRTGAENNGKQRWKADFPLYLMLALPVLFVFIFKYIPMFGIVISFKDYLPAKGIFGSKWCGLENFEVLFHMPGFFQTLRNTVVISLWKIVLGVIVPVVFTILLNEISKNWVKRSVQTLIYLPHFVSWVLLAGIFGKLLSGTGIVNQLLEFFGTGPIIFLGDNQWFQPTLIITNIWKEFGYGTIVYLAAISGVNEDLYEAAQIDGAGHWQQMWHVTLPGIVPIILLMSALSMGNVLNAGFDQIFNLYSPVVYESGDILDTLVYRMGFDSGEFGISTAASLFKSLISCAMVVASYKIAWKTSGYRVF